MARFILYLGLTVLAGLYALVFGEFFLRAMDPQPLMPRYVTGTDWGIRGNQPGITYRHWTPETETILTINSQGMRDDREFSADPPEGTCRIALLGDSYFMGYEANLEDSIAGRLETKFEAAGYDLDVLNFAVSGHGTSEMILHFENLARGFSPDIAIFQFHSSDFKDNLRAGLHRLEPDGSVMETGTSYLPAIGVRRQLETIPAYRWMSENSQIYAGLREKAAVFVKAVLARVSLQATAAEKTASKPETAPAGNLEHQLTAALIVEARQRAEAAGADWYLLDVPNRRGRTEFISQLELMELPAPTADRVISVLPIFQAHATPQTKLYFEKGHLHFTPFGNDLAAGVLFDRISRMSAAKLAKCREQPV